MSTMGVRSRVLECDVSGSAQVSQFPPRKAPREKRGAWHKTRRASTPADADRRPTPLHAFHSCLHLRLQLQRWCLTPTALLWFSFYVRGERDTKLPSETVRLSTAL